MKALLLAGLLLGCTATRTETVQVGAHSLQVEIAASPESRAQGLMHREHLPEGHGMLFVYPDNEVRRFWMKDTPLSLSIAFADPTGTIVHIADLEPHDRTPVSSLRPARYALEVNQSWFETHQVEIGDRIENLPQVRAR